MRIPILDFGYIELVESWGSDARIIESARMSTAKGFLGWGPFRTCPDHGGTWLDPTHGHHQVACTKCGKWEHKPGDEKLLRFLWENNHATPFEMAGAIIEVQAPIFVFREWHRHRTQSYNELSARYTPLPDTNYMPTPERCLVVNGANKQANAVEGAEQLTHEKVLAWLDELADVYEHAQRVYQRGLDIGIPKEVARLPVPVGRYSRMRASANLRNWLAFLTLRSDKNPGAQWEIREYGNALHSILAPLYPRTLALFDERKRAA